jgi:hypothetical protein
MYRCKKEVLILSLQVVVKLEVIDCKRSVSNSILCYIFSFHSILLYLPTPPKLSYCTSNTLSGKNVRLQTTAFHIPMYTNALRDLHQGFSLTMCPESQSALPVRQRERDAAEVTRTCTPTGHYRYL